LCTDIAITDEWGCTITKKTPLKDIKNFYPALANEIGSLGYHYLEDLKKEGWEKVCIRYAKVFPERLDVKIFILLAAGMQGMPKRRASEEMKKSAQELVRRIKSEKESPFRTRKAKKKT
jgi:hypothetical protein